MQIEDYQKAGKIAGEVREMVRVKDWVGKTVYEICEEIESEIQKIKTEFEILQSIDLHPYDKDHAIVVAKYRG